MEYKIEFKLKHIFECIDKNFTGTILVTDSEASEEYVLENGNLVSLQVTVNSVEKEKIKDFT